ncbi:substrate-binding domain-containing protein, partial [Vibrio parahaemolyticus]|nr:substrate-binding domain-containing protein [Vibrio parahaemolyticus]
MKKLIALMMVFVLSLSLVACSSGTDEGGENTGGSTEARKVGFVISTQANPFFVTLKEGAESKAKDLGVELIVLDSQDDPAKEASNVEDLITKKVDLIIINP